MERSDTDNTIQIKFNPKTSESDAQALARRIAEVEPQVTVALAPAETTQSLEVRWLRGRQTFVLYLPNDPSVDIVFRRIDGLKNL